MWNQRTHPILVSTITGNNLGANAWSSIHILRMRVAKSWWLQGKRRTTWIIPTWLFYFDFSYLVFKKKDALEEFEPSKDRLKPNWAPLFSLFKNDLKQGNLCFSYFRSGQLQRYNASNGLDVPWVPKCPVKIYMVDLVAAKRHDWKLSSNLVER